MLKFVGLLVGIMVITGCASNGDKNAQFEKVKVKDSYLAHEQKVNDSNGAITTQKSETKKAEFRQLQALEGVAEHNVERIKTRAFERDKVKVTMAANNLPAGEFIHYAFGEVLKANYVINADVKADKTQLTLNVQNAITKSEAFALIADLMSRHQITIDFENDTFFFQKNQLSKAKALISIGRDVNSVPNTAGQILQVVPLKYGIKLAVERTVKEMIDGKINVDFEQNALFITADRTNVIRALELVNLLDVPANRGKYIGLMSLTHIPVETFLAETKELLQSEGILAETRFDKTKNVLLIPLNHIGAIAVFAADEELLNRVKYWGMILDQPTKGANLQYFIYKPTYARATDLGNSVGQLLTLGRPKAKANSKSTGSSASSLAAETASNNETTFAAENISFVVDELSNQLVFSATGNDYQKLLPLLTKLDTLPKQILLELMIVEVSLTDDFKYGVEFALRNSTKFSLGTLGAFSAGKTGGLVMQGLDTDLFGTTEGEAVASFFRGNSLVNVVSNPTMLVRDGINANIKVGEKIPIRAATIVDDGVQQTSTEYRDTGVSVSVTPTVNAQGVILMQIDLDISNTVSTTADSPTPSIFQRALSTEAVVESGQTVILGGLISENSENGENKVPVLGDMPVLGNLFRDKSDTKRKTELVMLVTPRVLGSNDNWDKLINDFQTGLENIQIVNQDAVNP